MNFDNLTLQEMRHIYAAKTAELETLIDNYWAGAPEDLENSPPIKEQVRLLGHEIQELERVMAIRKSRNGTASESPPGSA